MNCGVLMFISHNGSRGGDWVGGVWDGAEGMDPASGAG